MINNKTLQKDAKVGEPLFEELAFKHFAKKYNISKEEILGLAEKKKDLDKSIPLSILKNTKLSSLESIVKFLRENKKLSYNIIGNCLNRNPKTLAVTYAVSRRKMSEKFSKDADKDDQRIPFVAFSDNLSVLESICVYLKSCNHTYVEIAHIIDKDQRTVWTVCKRAEIKLKRKNSEI